MTERLLAIEGTVNCRDIGGYPTQDGKQTRWGVYYRSDALDSLDTAGQQALIDQGITTVIDLRTAREVQRSPDKLPASIAFHHHALLKDGPDFDAILTTPDGVYMYTIFVDRFQPEIKAILETIAGVDSGGVLYHCAGGKDRTGIVTALLLGLAGVADEVIAQDYELTGDYTASYRPHWRAEAAARGEDMERYDKVAYPKAEFMLGTLQHLHATYGGVADYMRTIGLDNAVIGTLRSRLIET